MRLKNSRTSSDFAPVNLRFQHGIIFDKSRSFFEGFLESDLGALNDAVGCVGRGGQKLCVVARRTRWILPLALSRAIASAWDSFSSKTSFSRYSSLNFSILQQQFVDLKLDDI